MRMLKIYNNFTTSASSCSMRFLILESLHILPFFKDDEARAEHRETTK